MKMGKSTPRPPTYAHSRSLLLALLVQRIKTKFPLMYNIHQGCNGIEYCIIFYIREKTFFGLSTKYVVACIYVLTNDKITQFSRKLVPRNLVTQKNCKAKFVTKKFPLSHF